MPPRANALDDRQDAYPTGIDWFEILFSYQIFQCLGSLGHSLLQPPSASLFLPQGWLSPVAGYFVSLEIPSTRENTWGRNIGTR